MPIYLHLFVCLYTHIFIYVYICLCTYIIFLKNSEVIEVFNRVGIILPNITKNEF